MRKRKIETILLVFLATCSSSAVSNYKVLHAFGSGSDGSALEASVALDAKGNVYGTSAGGGRYGYGTVFRLVRKPDGRWVGKLLHEFKNGDLDGYFPYGNVTLDAAGNLYGTTALGGPHNGGTAFELTPGPVGWSLGLLYSFCAQPECSDGGSTVAGLTLDKAGNLYGASNVVYQIAPMPDGWTETVLYTFCSKAGCSDSGRGTYAGVILDGKGSLYGTTQVGGAFDEGVVFKLKPTGDGTWKERVLYSFGGSSQDGQQPGKGALALDSAGNLYGTTLWGGKYGLGVVFRLSRQPDGHWKEGILHHFRPGKSGNHPAVGVVVDTSGNLYGVTGYGGTDCDCGVVYKLAPNPDGTWTYSVLHRFKGTDGYFPYANLVLDSQGNLYGTTEYGGSGGGGVVFKIVP